MRCDAMLEVYAVSDDRIPFSGKLDFLALKWAVCEKFEDYLFYAPHFTVYMHNNPLTRYDYCKTQCCRPSLGGGIV